MKGTLSMLFLENTEVVNAQFIAVSWCNHQIFPLPYTIITKLSSQIYYPTKQKSACLLNAHLSFANCSAFFSSFFTCDQESDQTPVRVQPA
jgi:hypothetical protein